MSTYRSTLTFWFKPVSHNLRDASFWLVFFPTMILVKEDFSLPAVFSSHLFRAALPVMISSYFRAPFTRLTSLGQAKLIPNLIPHTKAWLVTLVLACSGVFLLLDILVWEPSWFLFGITVASLWFTITSWTFILWLGLIVLPLGLGLPTLTPVTHWVDPAIIGILLLAVVAGDMIRFLKTRTISANYLKLSAVT